MAVVAILFGGIYPGIWSQPLKTIGWIAPWVIDTRYWCVVKATVFVADAGLYNAQICRSTSERPDVHFIRPGAYPHPSFEVRSVAWWQSLKQSS